MVTKKDAKEDGNVEITANVHWMLPEWKVMSVDSLTVLSEGQLPAVLC